MPPYNKTFERLVQSDNELVGLVAYALYKQDKRSWALSNPDQAYTPPQTDKEIQRLRAEAEEMLTAFAQSVIAAEVPHIAEQAEASHVTKLIEEALKDIRQQGAWYRQIANGVLGSFGYSLVLFAILALASVFGSDLMKLLSAVASAAK